MRRFADKGLSGLKRSKSFSLFFIFLIESRSSNGPILMQWGLSEMLRDSEMKSSNDVCDSCSPVSMISISASSRDKLKFATSSVSPAICCGMRSIQLSLSFHSLEIFQ